MSVHRIGRGARRAPSCAEAGARRAPLPKKRVPRDESDTLFRAAVLRMRPTQIPEDMHDELPDSLEDAAARTEAAIIALRREGTLRAQHRREDGQNEHPSHET